MFGKAAGAEVAPARLATLANNLHTLLARVQRIVAAIDECPEEPNSNAPLGSAPPKRSPRFSIAPAVRCSALMPAWPVSRHWKPVAPYFEEIVGRGAPNGDRERFVELSGAQ